MTDHGVHALAIGAHSDDIELSPGNLQELR
jgi:LmbE family N-acetylglucosaminyl deacetylase